MCFLPESKAIVTDLFTVADFYSVVIKFSNPTLDSAFQRQLLVIKMINHDFLVNCITFFFYLFRPFCFK